MTAYPRDVRGGEARGTIRQLRRNLLASHSQRVDVPPLAESAPELVALGLVGALDDERERLGELEVRSC